MTTVANNLKNSAKSIFVANVKGGVGKSTLSIMLARTLAQKMPQEKFIYNGRLQYRPT